MNQKISIENIKINNNIEKMDDNLEINLEEFPAEGN